MKIWKWLTAREHRLVFCGILAALVATVAYAGVIVHGQLVDASLENLSSDPTSHSGRVYFNTSTNQPKIYNGSAWTGLGSGAGSGEKNYLASGSSSATGWTASDAGVTCTTPTTNLPDPSLSTALGVTGASGSTAFCYATFTLDDADFNKKMKLAFDQFAVSGYVASDMRVDVCSCGSAFSGGACSSGTVAQGCGTNATRLALSTDSSAVSALPALTGTYRTTWDSPGSSQKYIQVQVGLNGSNTHQLNLANIVVGPGVVTQGAAVQYLGSSLGFTPNNFGTVTNARYDAWRIGSNMRVHAYWTNGTVAASAASLTLPSGYAVDTTAISTQGSGSEVGHFTTVATVDTNIFSGNDAGHVFFDGSTTNTLYFAVKSGASSGVYDKNNATTIANSGTAFECWFEIPINEWAGSGTVNVVQNTPEFACSTTGTWDAAAATGNTVYGQAGCPITGALTAQRVKDLQWQYPQGAGDVVDLYIKYNGVWTLASGLFPFCAQGTLLGGEQAYPLSSTQYEVTFYQYSACTGASFGAAGQAWTSTATAWVAVKHSGNQAVGFGLATSTSSGLIGGTSATQSVAPLMNFTNGIQLPTTGGTAATLNAYEEGTFTPAVSCGTSGSVTNSSQQGAFTRIGREIFYFLYFRGTNSSCAGNVTVTGLPYTSVNTTDYYQGQTVSYFRNATTISSGLNAIGYIAANDNKIFLDWNVSGGTPTQIQGSTWGAGATVEFMVSGHYIKN